MEYQVIEYVEHRETLAVTRLREGAEAAEKAYEEADARWRDINGQYRRKVLREPSPEMRRAVIAALDARDAAAAGVALAHKAWASKVVSISERELVRRAVEAARTAVEEDAIRALRPGLRGQWEWSSLPADLAQQAARELSPEVRNEPSDLWVKTFVSAYFAFAKGAEVSVKFPPTEAVLAEVTRGAVLRN